MGPRVFPIVAASSCSGRGRQVTHASSGDAFQRSGDTWSRQERWGCGCPTGDVYTMVYEPKTSPLRVRLCENGAMDMCEALCQQTLAWNLSGPLKEAGATDVVFVD
ncbi:hypothetical protein [Polyangium sp. 6x1]|uniref:hypothetical protein n=1 Tax=Polyangium sp. 6x1 TaxID=3042689 RepID=UPI002482DD48|nr:hypothetical protein [Polyangium sp. 6x1]MDI1451905.1 hypothetical protein [Polyangium sp. 6x1]